MAMTPEQARSELAKRELARRRKPENNEDSENLLQKVMRYGIKDPAIGVLNMGREFANLPHKASHGHIPEFSPSKFDFNKALNVENPDSADNLIQSLFQIAPAFALPGANIGRSGKVIESVPKVGKYLSKAISDAIPQGLFSAAQAPHDQLKSGAQAAGTMGTFSILSEIMKGKNPIARNIARALAAGGGALLGRHAAKSSGFGEVGSDVASLLGGVLGGRGFKTNKEMKQELVEGVSPDIANPRIEAANKLNLDYLTPAEAGVSPWAAKTQGSLGRTPEGGKMLYEKGIKRRESERNAIEHTLEMIYSPKTMDKKIDEGYEALNQVNLPPEIPLHFKDNEIINAAKNMVETTPAYKESLKALLPKNAKLKEGQFDPQSTSLVYWDHVKRALDDMVINAKKGTNEARIISNTRRDLRDRMDKAFPEYKEARGLYERKKVREGFEKVFDQKEINGTNFYRALASQKKFDEVVSHLKNAPEAVENLKAMRLIFNDLMGPPTIKTAKGTEERGMNMERNEGDFLKNIFKHAFTSGKNDKAAIEFITSKDWGKQLEEINKISDKQLKAVALGLTLSKGVSQSVGNQNREPMEMELNQYKGEE